MRLRFKMMAALLATGLGAVALVGGVAYVSVNYKVDSLRRQQAAGHFHTYMTAYLAEYGDWPTAIATESFDRFVRRMEAQEPRDGEQPSQMLERMPPRINDQARQLQPLPDGSQPQRLGDGPPPDPTVPAARRRSDVSPPDGGRPRPAYRDAPPDVTLPVPRRNSLASAGLENEGAPRPLADQAPDAEPPPRDGDDRPAYGPRPPRGGFAPEGDGLRPPRGGYGPGPDGRRPPRDGFGPGAEGHRPPPDGFGPDADGRRPRRDGYGPGADGPRPPRDGAVPAGDAQQPAAPDSISTAVRPAESDRPPPRRPGDGQPPFRFILSDADFKVLLGGGQFRIGDALPEKWRATAKPIVVKDKTVAYMSSDGALTPTPQEQKYLDALYNSLLWGIAAAAGLASLLGVLLSSGLTRSLSNLTRAVKGMHKGELRQQVTVKGKDEVAALATAFNEMSEQLAHSHDELKASHQTILEQAEQLRELSIRDALTELYNRRHFDEQANTLFNQAVRHKRPLTLVICDIDHFKKINDKFSHATGDTVLRHVGQILRKHMRLSDLVARYGGEEFVMAFPETPGPHAAALCDKLRNLIESFPWHEVHPDLKVTMSMGVCADVASGSAETMLQKADALLYRAKESGRNQVCFA